MGFIQLTEAPFLQWLHDMTDADEIAEGHLWGNAEQFRKDMGDDREVWVVKFRKIVAQNEYDELVAMVNASRGKVAARV